MTYVIQGSFANDALDNKVNKTDAHSKPNSLHLLDCCQAFRMQFQCLSAVNDAKLANENENESNH